MTSGVAKLPVFWGVLGFGAPVLAGGPTYSRWSVTWSSVDGVTTVPALSGLQLAMLGVLLLVIAARILRRHSAVASLLVTGGLGCAAIAGGLLYSDKPTAGGGPAVILAGASCSGSETYEAGENPPPCFKNTCGSPVTVDVQFVEGLANGSSYTFEECNVEPDYCRGEALTDVIPSGETLYNLPYCTNGFGG